MFKLGDDVLESECFADCLGACGFTHHVHHVDVEMIVGWLVWISSVVIISKARGSTNNGYRA